MNFLWNIIIWKQYQISKLIFQHSIVKRENLTTNRASHSFSAALTPSDIFSWHPSLCSRSLYFLEHEQVIAAHCFPGKPGWQGSLLCPLLSIVLQSPRAGLAGCPCRGTSHLPGRESSHLLPPCFCCSATNILRRQQKALISCLFSQITMKNVTWSAVSLWVRQQQQQNLKLNVSSDSIAEICLRAPSPGTHLTAALQLLSALGKTLKME